MLSKKCGFVTIRAVKRPLEIFLIQTDQVFFDVMHVLWCYTCFFGVVYVCIIQSMLIHAIIKS